MSRPWSKNWFDDCMKWRGKVLEGRYRHWCFEMDELPVDETTPEWNCHCFDCKCGTLMISKQYPFGKAALDVHDDIFTCPNRRWWNFWKHYKWNLYLSDARRDNAKPSK